MAPAPQLCSTPADSAADAPSTADFLFSFGLVLLIFTSLAGSLSFWEEGFVDIFPASRYSVLIPLALLVTAPATGTWRLSVNIEWDEVEDYPYGR